MASYTISNKVNFEEVSGFQPDDPTLQFPTIIGNYDFSFTVSIQSDPPDEGGEGSGDWVLISTTCTSHPDFVTASSVSVDSVNIARNMNVEVFPGERFETVRYGYEKEEDEMIAANSAAYPSFPEDPNDIGFDANTPAANSEFTANTVLDDNDLNVIDLNTSIFPTGDETYGLFETFNQPDALNADPDSSVYAYIVPPVRERSESYTFVSVWENTLSLQTQEVFTTYPQDFQWSWVPGLQTLGTLVDRSRF